MRHDKFRLADVEQLDSEARELHHAVVRSAGMPVVRADREAGAPVEVCLRIDVAGRMNDMVEAAR